MVPKPSKFTSDGGWQRSGKTFHWANDRFALHSRFSIVGCKLPWPKIPWFELRMSQYFSCGKPSNGSSNSFHVFCQTIGIPSNLFLRSSVYISIKHRQIAAQSLKFALHNRSSIIVGCKLPWHKICWFQQSRNFQKEVEVVMSGVRSPFFPASRLDPSLDCRNAHSWLPPLLISRSECDSIFQLLDIYGMCDVCSLVFGWV